MQIQLTEEELNQLTRNVTQSLKKYFTDESVVSEIYKDADKTAKEAVKTHRPEIEASITASNLLEPIVKGILKKNEFLNDIVERAVVAHFNTDSFKRISIEMMQDRIDKLEGDN